MKSLMMMSKCNCFLKIKIITYRDLPYWKVRWVFISTSKLRSWRLRFWIAGESNIYSSKKILNKFWKRGILVNSKWRIVGRDQFWKKGLSVVANFGKKIVCGHQFWKKWELSVLASFFKKRNCVFRLQFWNKRNCLCLAGSEKKELYRQFWKM